MPGLVAAFLGAACAAPPSPPNCYERVWSEILDAQVEWQEELSFLIRSNREDLAELADLSKRLQQTLAERNALRVGYLSRTDASRLDVIHDDLNTGAIAWTDADERALGTFDERYAEAQSRLVSLRMSTDGHPDWDQLRSYFATQLSRSPEYREALERITAAREQALVDIQLCASDDSADG